MIIDEASQSDVTALAALYLGREHVVVGDKEQVTPDAIGQQSDQVQRLVSTNLQGVPNSHLYDGQTSIYDLAETAFGGVVALREHFRCVPEIIQFSNHLSYNNTIRPLREPLSANVRPAVVAHRVNGFRDDRRKTTKSRLRKLPRWLLPVSRTPTTYRTNHLRMPTSFGVISLLGDEQALMIETSCDAGRAGCLCQTSASLRQRGSVPGGRARRRLSFQSSVDGPPQGGPLALRDAGPKDLYKKRYNVAVSRARNQLWVVIRLTRKATSKPVICAGA